MLLKFNSILQATGLDPSEVKLLRHADRKSVKGRTIHELWRNDRPAFDLYQRVQAIERRKDFGDAKYWASFTCTFEGETVFLGLYKVQFAGVGKKDILRPNGEGLDRAGEYHEYRLTEMSEFQHLAGRLYVDWGRGTRSWIQRADRQDKAIAELRREVQDPEFPGYAGFIRSLSDINKLPFGWKVALRSTRGVYLLTCPKTKEQYVGKADGEEGFLGRWLFYAATGHGGNVALKSREPSDYKVSILEVARSAASPLDILAMESRWKQKLQSREMGLNRN